MSLVPAMNVEQNKGGVCGLRFGLRFGADKYMEMLKRKIYARKAASNSAKKEIFE